MITIDEIDNGVNVEIICDPPQNDTIKELIRKEAVDTVRLIYLGDDVTPSETIKLALRNGGELEVNALVQVKVNGVLASDNDDLYDKLKTIFPLP